MCVEILGTSKCCEIRDVLGICVPVCMRAQSCPALCTPRDCSQTPLSMGFPRQVYPSGLPFPTPEDLPEPGIKPVSFGSPALAGRFFTPFRDMNALIYKLSQTCCPTDVYILAF